MLAQHIEWNDKDMDSLEDLKLYDIMGCDYTPYLKKNKTFGYDLIIEDENGDEQEMSGVHPLAIDSMAYFCRRFLMFYDNLNK